MKDETILEEKDFDFVYAVEAAGEEEAKRKATTKFNSENPSLNLDDFTVGFCKN